MKKLLKYLFKRFSARKHKYPTSCLVHRRNNNIVFEIEFNWYDENLDPVSVVRDVRSQKIFSIRADEMTEFVEYTGSDANPGLN